MKYHTLQREIKEYLDNNQIDVFNRAELYNYFKGTGLHEFEKALRGVVKNEPYLMIEKGKYCRYTFRNEYVIGNALTDDATIGYWSAMNIHGLTEQFPNRVYIQTTKNKINKEVFGVEYKFIRIRTTKRTGIIKMGMGNHQFRITDIEKTIVDCFDLPQYSGGFSELIRAFNKTKINARNLIHYCEKINNIAAIKRLGFLAELLEKKELKSFIKYAGKKTNKKYSQFDVFGFNEGKFDSKWKLRLNIPEEEIFEIANSIY